MALQEEQEANINIDYFEGVVRVYTNRAMVINKINDRGFEPTYEYVKGEVFGATYTVPMKDISKILSSAVFKSFKQY